MSGFTTLMIRHVPRKFTVSDIRLELALYLRPEDVDFVYVPGVANADTNMGYAFVNIPDPVLAHATCQCLAGKPWSRHTGGRRVRVQPAFVQGLAANLAHFAEHVAHRLNSVLKHLPQVFDNGLPVPLDVALRVHCVHCESPRALPFAPPLAPVTFQATVITGVDFFES